MIPVEAQLLRLLMRRESWETFGEVVDPTTLPTTEHQRLFDLLRQYHTNDLGMPHRPNVDVDLLWAFLRQKDKVDGQHPKLTMYTELLSMIKEDDTPPGLAANLVTDYVQGSVLAQMAQLSLRHAEAGTSAALRDQIWKRAKELAIGLDTLEGAEVEVKSTSLRDNADLKGVEYERIPMGVAPKIDAAVGGGFPVGKLICAVAPPGVGKTRLLVNIGAAAIRAGRNVVHATLEIDQVELARWYYSVLTGISYDELRDSAKARRRAERIWRDHTDWGDVIVADYAASSCSIGTIKRLVKQEAERMLEEGDKLSVFLLDYIALLDGLGESMYSGLGVAAREIRKLANKYKIVVYTAAQANRGALIEGETKVQHIADSMEIPRVMDALLMLSQSDQEKHLGQMRMNMAKNRFGSDNPQVELSTSKTTLALTQMSAGGLG